MLPKLARICLFFMECLQEWLQFQHKAVEEKQQLLWINSNALIDGKPILCSCDDFKLRYQAYISEHIYYQIIAAIPRQWKQKCQELPNAGNMVRGTNTNL